VDGFDQGWTSLDASSAKRPEPSSHSAPLFASGGRIPLRVPPCPGRQVGEGGSRTLDANETLALAPQKPRDWDNWVTVNEATSTPDHLAFSFKTDAAYYEVMLHNINDHWRGDFRAKDFRQVWGGTLEGHGGATKMQGRWEEIQDGYKESFYFELELD
jgi:hypothetical protein